MYRKEEVYRTKLIRLIIIILIASCYSYNHKVNYYAPHRLYTVMLYNQIFNEDVSVSVCYSKKKK